MTAGYQFTLASVNSQAGVVAQGVRQALYQASLFETWLAGFGAANLETQLNMATADANLLVSAMADLADFETMWNGGQSIHLTGTYNYSQFAKQLTAYS